MCYRQAPWYVQAAFWYVVLFGIPAHLYLAWFLWMR
jgi:hypothetical protein